MSKQNDWRGELEQLAEKLRDPFRMRMTVAAITVAVMCLLISDPIQGKMKRVRRELNQLESTVRTAEEVLLLRTKFQQVEDRILKGESNDVVVSHLIDIVRSEAVELMRIDAQAAQKLGLLHTVRVTVDVSGSFESLVKLLHRFDDDRYLNRVETFSITPAKRDRTQPSMSVTILVLEDAA